MNENKERGQNSSIFIRSEYFDVWKEINEEAGKLKIGVGSFICKEWKNLKRGEK